MSRSTCAVRSASSPRCRSSLSLSSARTRFSSASSSVAARAVCTEPRRGGRAGDSLRRARRAGAARARPARSRDAVTAVPGAAARGAAARRGTATGAAPCRDRCRSPCRRQTPSWPPRPASTPASTDATTGRRRHDGGRGTARTAPWRPPAAHPDALNVSPSSRLRRRPRREQLARVAERGELAACTRRTPARARRWQPARSGLPSL